MLNDYCIYIIETCLLIPEIYESPEPINDVLAFWFNENPALAIPFIAILPEWRRNFRNQMIDNDLDFGEFPFGDIPWYDLDFGEFPFGDIPWYDLDFGEFPFGDIPWYDLDFGEFPFGDIPWNFS